MKNQIIATNLLVFGIAHMLVDFACLGVVFGIFGSKILNFADGFYLVILYNLVAFALQAPFGYFIDNFKIPIQASVLGIILVGISTLLLPFPITAVIFAGIGNALFHVGGGIISLNLTPKKAFAPGVYVSTGAIGLLAGTLIGKSGNFIAWPFIVSFFIISIFILSIKKPEISYDQSFNAKTNYFELILLLLLLSIAIRGFVGLALTFPWLSNLHLAIILTTAIVAGKALGGIIGDKIGWQKTAIIGLLISIPLLSFFSINPLLAIIGSFFFNLTMPITLTAISNMLPGRAGFAFGLTTLALAIGSLSTYTELKLHFTEWIIFAAIMLAAISIYFALKFYFRTFNARMKSNNNFNY